MRMLKMSQAECLEANTFGKGELVLNYRAFVNTFCICIIVYTFK